MKNFAFFFLFISFAQANTYYPFAPQSHAHYKKAASGRGIASHNDSGLMGTISGMDKNVIAEADKKYAMCVEDRQKMTKLMSLAAGLVGRPKFMKIFGDIQYAEMEKAYKTQLEAVTNGTVADFSPDVSRQWIAYLQKTVKTKEAAAIIAGLHFKTDAEESKACNMTEVVPELYDSLRSGFDNELEGKTFANAAETAKFYKEYLAGIVEKIKKGELSRSSPVVWFIDESGPMTGMIQHLADSDKLDESVKNEIEKSLDNLHDVAFSTISPIEHSVLQFSKDYMAKNGKRLDELETKYSTLIDAENTKHKASEKKEE